MIDSSGNKIDMLQGVSDTIKDSIRSLLDARDDVEKKMSSCRCKPLNDTLNRKKLRLLHSHRQSLDRAISNLDMALICTTGAIEYACYLYCDTPAPMDLGITLDVSDEAIIEGRKRNMEAHGSDNPLGKL